ncbi:sulfate ABC transporter permease subunit CysT [Moraxella caviae]|uniref:Sulfate transport system permease protein CysT n=1 Tax=Moraxella caviae TaxID=34060 RepID=A0A1T0A2U3_9GAMM|nr:sulfate ABC transporter permease subunit CysT [Moraxella caviae]OOR90096.1 sulfate ABC transporter permease subunit CysT [Moraxella caviae]STZ14716.1 Sulfate transport system permease protein CysW [Moraxella caviae]VEW11433.1 Sulfate transport system permease protein CysW [Moraxella caviae]VEW14056.1 Sulfate transport system permease protein CysW [Moraxella caviae]
MTNTPTLAKPTNKRRRIMPFFGLSMGISVLALSLLVVLPFAMMVLTTLSMGIDDIIRTIKEPQVLAAIKLSLLMAIAATLTNVVFGVLIAWVLVRYEFWGKSIINALVDLPFALPTAVTGIALATLYAPFGLFGQFFAKFGIKIAFTPIGIWLALVVVSFPFIVRAVQPVLAEVAVEFEEAAAVMGANRWQIFLKVLLPEIAPAILIGAGMMFARATGEYGSVIFIAGNIPMQSEILPLIIVSKLEQFDVAGASCVALFMLLISLIMLFAINFAQWKLSARLGAKTN